jgi:hypothetical protein
MVSSREGIDGESAPGPPAVIIGCLEGENPPTGWYAIAVCGLNAASAETKIPKGNAAQARTPIGFCATGGSWRASANRQRG